MKTVFLAKYVLFMAFLGVFVFLLASGCGAAGSLSMNNGRLHEDSVISAPIRLLTACGVKSVSISALGPCKIVNGENKAQMMALKSGDLQIACSDKGLSVNDDPVSPAVIRIIPGGGKIKIGENVYRGLAEIRFEKDAINVINELGLEELVMSQVGREVSSGFKPEAQKAQAIAARTFVLHEKMHSKYKGFDLKNLAGEGKIYFGTATEHVPGNEAVDATCGITLKYQGETAFTPYFSNCGGYTEDVSEVWGTASKEPYLTPVPCFFCKAGEHYTWQREIAKTHILATLNAAGRSAGDIYEIDPNYEVSKSGRTKTVRISTDKGQITLALNDFRAIVGYNVLMSARALTCRPKAGTFYFTGKGWGHGVGMCQDGANGMAKQGHSYKEILRRYYPGTEIASR